MLPRPPDWSLMKPARPPTPCKSTKSRLPDAEITKGPFTVLIKPSQRVAIGKGWCNLFVRLGLKFGTPSIKK